VFHDIDGSPWLASHLNALNEFYDHVVSVSLNKSNPRARKLGEVPLNGVREVSLRSFSGLPLVLKLLFRKCDIYAHGLRPTQISFFFAFFTSNNLFIFMHFSPILFNLPTYTRRKIRNTINARLLSFALSKSKLLFVFSLELSSYLLKNNISPNRIRKIPLGITNFNLHESQSRDESRIRILMVGRLSQEKNYSYALNILKRLRDIRSDFIVDIFGLGPLNTTLVSEIENLDLHSIVTLQGWKPEIIRLYSNYDLLLHTSHSEGYGQVIVEALMNNIKVFTSRVGVSIDLEMIGVYNLLTFDLNEPIELIVSNLNTFLDEDVFPLEKNFEFLQQHSLDNAVDAFREELSRYRNSLTSETENS
jgi:glycosyltransferase involved in cell wall biosynthesis